MEAMLGRAWALCGSAHGIAGGGLLAGLFLVGLAGSALHCAPMCGGFVLGQVAGQLARLPAARLCEWRRASAALLLPYHLGRLTTYAALGALAATSAGALSRAPWLHGLAAVLLAAAAAAFLWQALARLASRRGWAMPRTPGAWSRLEQIAGRLGQAACVKMLVGRRVTAFRAPTWTRNAVAATPVRRLMPRGGRDGGFALGLALGFLPCGLVYDALLAAAASGSAWRGAAAMVAFGLGTVPALVVVGLTGQAAGHRWRRAISSAAPLVIGCASLLLLGLAWQQVQASS